MSVWDEVCGQCNGRLAGESFLRRVPRLGGKRRLVCPPCTTSIDAQLALDLICTQCRRQPATDRRRIPTRAMTLSVETEPVCAGCAIELDRITERLGRQKAAA